MHNRTLRFHANAVVYFSFSIWDSAAYATVLSWMVTIFCFWVTSLLFAHNISWKVLMQTHVRIAAKF